MRQLDLMTTIQHEADDGVFARVDRWDVAGPGTLQAICSFDSEIGSGHFELDVAVGERPVLVGTQRSVPTKQSYFPRLGFEPAPILSMHPAEIGAEKLAAIHRRSSNRNPKDIWDLWKWLTLPPNDRTLTAFRQLWPARLWLDGQRWRGRGWFTNLRAADFDWDRLRGLIPRGRAFATDQVLQDLRTRLDPWMDEDEDILEDAGAGRRATGEIEGRIRAAIYCLRAN